MGSKLRRLLHYVVADLLYYSGAIWLWRFLRQRLLGREICVLGLHRVLTKAEQSRCNSLDGMVLTEETYVRLLKYLQQRFHVISLESLFGETTGADHTKPRCLLTFDDGWRDTYTRAHRWLKEFDLPATVFLTTGSIGTHGGFWIERLIKAWRVPALRAQMQSACEQLMGAKTDQQTTPEGLVEQLNHMPAAKRNSLLKRLLPQEEHSEEPDEVDSMVTWNQVMEMSCDGVAIGAHTVNHPLLIYENDVDVERELRLSKQILEEKLGEKVCAFAYPNGNWNENVRRWVQQVGYQAAFTTEPGWYRSGQDPYTIGRILLHEGNVTGRKKRFSPAMFNLTLARGA